MPNALNPDVAISTRLKAVLPPGIPYPPIEAPGRSLGKVKVFVVAPTVAMKS